MSEHVDVAFFEMETDRAISKRRNVLNLAGHTHLRALARRPALSRHHRHLARAIVDLIQANGMNGTFHALVTVPFTSTLRSRYRALLC